VGGLFGGGGGGNKFKGYEAPVQFGDLSPGQVQGMGVRMPKLNIDRMVGDVTRGRLMTGQRIPQYQAGRSFNFSPTSIRNVSGRIRDPSGTLRAAPQRAYQGALDVAQENVTRGAQGAYEQAARAMGSRGMGRGGMASAQNMGIARNVAGQLSDLSRQSAFQQAQDQMQMNQAAAQTGLQAQDLRARYGLQEQDLRARTGFQTQQAQAAENLARAQQSLQAQQALSGIQSQQMGLMSNLQRQGTQQAMAPYQMLMDIYRTNLSPAFKPGEDSGGSSKNPFEAIAGAAGKAASFFCLPTGTMIEMADGTEKEVQDIVIGDEVKEGGSVTAVTKRLRPKYHRFFEHYFCDGRNVVMTLGHPYFDRLDKALPVEEHPSKFTHDIATTGGFYIINGVKIGSTIDG